MMYNSSAVIQYMCMRYCTSTTTTLHLLLHHHRSDPFIELLGGAKDVKRWIWAWVYNCIYIRGSKVTSSILSTYLHLQCLKEWQLLPATACNDKWEYVNHRWCTCHVCTPHPLIAGHLYVPTELVCSSDRHVGSVFSICSSTYMAGVSSMFQQQKYIRCLLCFCCGRTYGRCPILLYSSNRHTRSVYIVLLCIWTMCFLTQL